MEENEQYARIRKFLTEELKKDLDSNPIIIDSGDLGILAVGEFGGHSIRALVQYVADKEGKKIEYRD
jgi:hypothetical protein